ncbi:MAG: patatin-like phospholipase family protein [Candidatus Omnitrophota bacterium]
MDHINKDIVLRQLPLFEGLPEDSLKLVSSRCEIREYKKNQVIYEEGSGGDAFYCVITGRVVTYTKDKFGADTVIEYLHRGKYFGIISLLTDETHSVTAKAFNDSAILFIKKDDFNFILNKVPHLAIDLSKTLSRRLKNKSVHRKTIFESTIISVFSSYSGAGKSVYALNLALSLRKETNKSVIILDIYSADLKHSLPEKLGISDNYRALNIADIEYYPSEIIKEFTTAANYGIDLISIAYKDKNISSAKKLLNILSILVNDYHYIVLDLPAELNEFICGILNQSDFIHILTSPQPTDLKRTSQLIIQLKQEFNFQENKIRVIINEYKKAVLSYQQERDLLGFEIYATLSAIETDSSLPVICAVESEYAKAVRRISRQVGENLIGLALGVGVGYGFCHIGVLKVLEEEKIPIDVIAGSSIGAVIASLWATGRPAKEILNITREEFKQPKYTWGLIDLTFPSLGFIKGNKLYGFLKKYLGNKTFYDVKLPLKIIASNIRKKEPKVFDKGLLIDAVMASCAMPGVFNPVRHKEEMLLDGGVISPLPTEVLFRMGLRKIIAVNVTPTREDILRQYEKIKDELAATKEALKRRKWFRIKQYFQNRFKTNILDIIFSSIELMQSQMIQKEGQLADIVLHPDTSGLHWLELYKSAEFSQRGEEEARRNLDKIKKIVND